jgi:hypothetical protein
MRLPHFDINQKSPHRRATVASGFDAYFGSARLTTDHYRSKRLRPAEEIPICGPFYDQTKILCRSAAHRIQQLGSNCAIINGAVTFRHRNFEMSV